MNSEFSRGLPSSRAAVRSDGLVFVLLALSALLFSACQATPTPTLEPIPTATYIPTETPVPTEAATPTAAPIRAVVTDTLRVREVPSLSGRILTRLKKDSVVSLLARSDDNLWYGIEYPPDSGEHAWIAVDFVRADSSTDQLPIGFTLPPPPAGAIFADVKHLLNVRRGPSKDFDVIATLPVGAHIALIARSEDGKWYQTLYPPDSLRRAWILGDEGLLDLAGSVDQMPVAPSPPTPTPAPTPVPRPTRTPGAPGPAGTGRILISSNRRGGYNIYSIAENGAVRQPLTNFGEAFGARFSPDGNQIVFYHTIATSPVVVNHIYLMNSDGSGLRDISAGGGFSDTDPDWSPDGSRIAFVRTARAGAPEIWVMNAGGSGARRLVSLSLATGISIMSVGDFAIQPRWSPDGGRVAYAAVPRTSNPGAPLFPNIFVVNANGSGETQLTDNDLINSNPTWSPDGRQIAWSAKDFINRQNWRVWLMNASGGNERVLIGAPFGDPGNGIQVAEWIGNRMLLAGWTGSWNVYLANADGSNLTQVTNSGADDRPTDWQP